MAENLPDLNKDIAKNETPSSKPATEPQIDETHEVFYSRPWALPLGDTVFFISFSFLMFAVILAIVLLLLLFVPFQ